MDGRGRVILLWTCCVNFNDKVKLKPPLADGLLLLVYTCDDWKNGGQALG